MMHIGVDALHATIILLIITSVLLCWHYILYPQLLQRLQVRVGGLGLTSIYGLIFSPHCIFHDHKKEPTLWKHVVEKVANKSHGKLHLLHVSIGLVWIRFHWPTSESPGWINVRISNPQITMCAMRGMTRKPPSPSKASTPSHKVTTQLNEIPRSFRKSVYMMRNSILRFLCRLVDVRITGLSVQILNHMGEQLLAYNQEFIDLSLRASRTRAAAASSPISASGESGASLPAHNSNVIGNLKMSPLVISTFRSPQRHPIQALIIDTETTVQMHLHMTMLGRIKDLHIDTRLHGLTISASELQQTIVEIQQSSVFGSGPSGNGMGHHGQVGDMGQKTIPTGQEVLAHLTQKLSNFTSVRPKMSLICKRAFVTYDPSRTLNLVKHPDPLLSLGIMLAVEEIALDIGCESSGTNQDKLNTDLHFKGISADLYNFGELSGGQRTWQLVETRGLTAKAALNIPRTIPFFRTANRKTPETQWLHGLTVKGTIDIPTIALSDELVCLLHNKAPISGPHNPASRAEPSSSHNVSQSNDAAAEKWIRTLSFVGLTLQPTLGLQIIQPIVSMKVTRYTELPGEAVFLFATSKHVRGNCTVIDDKPGGTTADGSSRSVLSTPSNMALEVTLEVGRTQVSCARDSATNFLHAVPLSHDEFLTVQKATLTAHVVPMPATESLPTSIHAHTTGTVGDIALDLSRLINGEVVDYFRLGVALSSQIHDLPKLRPVSPPAIPEVKDIPARARSLVVTAYSQIAVSPITCVFLSEDSTNTLVLRSGGTLVQSSRSLDIVAQDERRHMTTSLRAESSDLAVICIGGVRMKGEGLPQISGDYTKEVAHVRRIECFVYNSTSSDFKPPEPTIKVDEVAVDVNIQAIYVALLSTLYSVKLAKLFGTPEQTSSSSADGPVLQSETGGRKPLKIEVRAVVVDLMLPENVKLHGRIDDTTLEFFRDHQMELGWQALQVDVHPMAGITHERLLAVHRVCVRLERISRDNSTHLDKQISCTISNIQITIPHTMKMSLVIENLLNFQKGIKVLCAQHYGFRATSTCSPRGHTIIEEYLIRTIKFASEEIRIVMIDDPFESHLARNYILGFEEQEGRIARDNAFQKKVASLAVRDYTQHIVGGSTAIEIENTWWMLQEFNSRSWLENIAASKEAPDWPPPLMTTVISKFSVELTPPTLPAETVEDSLHILDADTPARNIYDELKARNILITMGGLSLRLRDYHLPLLHLPAGHHNCWRTEGLLIIAEPLSGIESKRAVSIPMEPLLDEPLIVTRAVNSTKIYSQLATTITTSSAMQLCWGAAIEPGMSEMMSVFDSFTKPNVDPSAPIGWWDKLRLIMHGHNVVHITGGGGIRARILGSTSPYFNRKKHVGTEGIDISLSHGVRIDFNGSDSPNEDISIECGTLEFSLPATATADTSSPTDRKAQADVIAHLAGGVKIGLGFEFVPTKKKSRGKSTETVPPKKTHSEIVLRAPEFCRSDAREPWDSFKGFRTERIHFTLSIDSPRTYYSDLSEPLNYLNLSVDSLDRFFTVTKIYQSVLTSLPIRRGRYFSDNGSPVSKQKLGRVISTLTLKTNLYPLLIGFVADVEEGNGAVGLRCRAAKMYVNMTWKQHLLRQKPPSEDFLTRKSVTKWNLSASDMELTDIEARAISLGSGMKSEHENANAEDMSCDAADLKDWLFSQDMGYCEEEGQIRMIPFAWTPRVIYFRRKNEASLAMQEATNGGKDVYGVQILLFRARLRDIESSIRHYLDIQRTIESQIAITAFDSNLREKSQEIVEKMLILHEKKVVIERYIQSCEKRIESNDLGDYNAASAPPTERKCSQAQVFKHRYIVHNLNFLWKRSVRNILFAMLSFQEKRMAVKYCLSNSATRVMSQLVASFAERKHESYVQLLESNSTSQQESVPDMGKHHPQVAQPKSTKMAVMAMEPTGAQALLEKLVSEVATSFNVPCEGSNDTGGITHDLGPGNGAPLAGSVSAVALKKYSPSKDPQSPDYVAEDQTFESNYIVQLINPQVNLEAESKESSSSQLETVVVAAESMQLRNILILDAQSASIKSADDYDNRNEQIIKRRAILNIQNAQLFVAKQEESTTNTDQNHPEQEDSAPAERHRQDFRTFSERLAQMTGLASASTWPLWVPMECLIDHSSHCGVLQRVVERTNASIHHDAPNPLYLKSVHAANSPETAQSLHVNFPNFVIFANADQYVCIYDVVENLLVYRDPIRGERTQRLKKTILVLEQMEDLRKVQETVLTLQQKIKSASSVLRSGTGPGSSHYSPSRKLELQRHVLQYEDELIVIVNALKTLQILEQKRKSVAVAWQTNVLVGKIMWSMLLDDNAPLCQWTMDSMQFTWVQNEDQSSVNTVLIDHMTLVNHMNTPNAFKDVLVPYNPDRKDPDYTRHKMLRVYWREMAPVAGIKVVDHFEVNIYPLLIQVTYDMAKQIIFYLFPERKARAEAKLSLASTAAGGGGDNPKDKENKRLSRVESMDMPGSARSFRSSASEASASLYPPAFSSSNLDDPVSTSRKGSTVVDTTSTAGETSPNFERKARKARGGQGIVLPNLRNSTSSARPPETSRELPPGNRLPQQSTSSPPAVDTHGKMNELKQMQARASENRSFIYIKMPGGQHCLSYRGSKEKNIEDLYMFAFRMPTLEFRNKTWTWLDFLDAVKKEAFRAVLANTGALVREKLFQKQKRKPSSLGEHAYVESLSTSSNQLDTYAPSMASSASIKSLPRSSLSKVEPHPPANSHLNVPTVTTTLSAKPVNKKTSLSLFRNRSKKGKKGQPDESAEILFDAGSLGSLDGDDA
ncbi:golgi-body localization protein domain-containing protein [Phlyctochytrium arcticum]|nr:golgi-body localization protein domain-containing protein [Phlyctochytrium arcticum]